jgi:RNA polymerase sigma factor (sigma-70 family)
MTSAAIKATGFTNFIDALTAYQERRDPNGAWYCLEVVRPMVYGVVNTYIRHGQAIRAGSTLDTKELEQEAFGALIEVLGDFKPPSDAKDDPEYCVRAWNRYANLVIKSPLRKAYSMALGAVEAPPWALKIAHSINVAISDIEVEKYASRDELRQELIFADPVEVARRAKVPLSKVKTFLRNGLHLLPQERYVDDFDLPKFKDIALEASHLESTSVMTRSQDPEIILTAEESELLHRAMRLLDQAEASIISLHFGLDGPVRTLSQISEQLGLSVKQVRTRQEQALGKIGDYLANSA